MLNNFYAQYRRIINISIALIVILLIAVAIVYEPVTRKFVGQDATCNYCHLPWEFNPGYRLSATKAHGSKEDPVNTQPTCVECHAPEGWWNATYIYLHIFSFTDLFGYMRDRDTERAGDWIPPRAATSYRVRDRLYQYDGVTCRSCHSETDEKWLKEKKHKKVVSKEATCIECHMNLVHRPVDERDNEFEEFKKPAPDSAEKK